MNKRKLLITGFFVLIFLSFLAIRSLGRFPFTSADIWKAIPRNSAAVLSVSRESWDRDLWKNSHASTAYSLIQSLRREMNLYRALVETEISPERINFPLLFSIQNTGRGEFSMVMVVDLKKTAPKEKEWMEGLQADRSAVSTFRGQTVYRLTLPGGQRLAYARYRNLLIVSSFPLFVEDAIRQLKERKGNWPADRSFASLLPASSGFQDFSILLRPDGLRALFYSWLKGPGEKALKKTEESLRWVRLDGHMNWDILTWEGEAVPTGEGLFRAFNGQEPQQPGPIFSVLPEGLAWFTWLGFSNIRAFYDQWDGLSTERFSQVILPWADRELAMVTTQSYHDKLASDLFWVIHKREEALAESGLQLWANQQGLLDSFEYQTFTVRQVLENQLFPPLLGEDPYYFQNPYFVSLEEYVVFSNSKSALQIWIDQYIVGKTLANNTDFMAFFANQKEPVQAYCYGNIDRMNGVMDPILAPVLAGFFHPDVFPCRQIGLGLFREGNRIHMKGQCWLDRGVGDPGSLVWMQPLEGTVSSPPAVVDLGGGPMVVVQDHLFTLYAFDARGDLRWKRKLDGALLSDPVTIDLSGDQRQQLLVSTARAVYLFDDSGKEEPGFPITLNVEATAGVLAVDFEKINEYSFFIPGANNSIYGLNEKGEPLKGWNPRSNTGIIRFPLQHFQRTNRDYLLALNEEGTFFAFKRDGSLRFAPLPLNRVFNSPPAFQSNTSAGRMVATDETGLATVINLVGQTFQLRVGAGANRDIRFVFTDIAGDDRKDYISMSGSDISAYSYQGNNFRKLFDIHLDHPQAAIFTVRSKPGAKEQIGTVDPVRKQIFLFDSQGKPYPGFPLAGTTRFTLGDLVGTGQRALVVGYEDQVYVYRLNF